MSVMAAVDMADEVVYLRSRFDALLSLCNRIDDERRHHVGYGQGEMRTEAPQITTDQVRQILDGRQEITLGRTEPNVVHRALLALLTDHHPDCTPPCMCTRLTRRLQAREALEKVVR